eukprot:9414874-Pyramimonas_sp.AAC.1
MGFGRPSRWKRAAAEPHGQSDAHVVDCTEFVTHARARASDVPKKGEAEGDYSLPFWHKYFVGWATSRWPWR